MNKQIKNDITLTASSLFAVPWSRYIIIPMQRTRRANIEQYRVITKANSQLIKGHDTNSRGGGGGTDSVK